jgi:excisionase family DNA binding protein
MSEKKLLTVREVSHLLDVTEKEVVELAESGILPAYKIGGLYLRFKKEQVLEFKKSTSGSSAKPAPEQTYSFEDRVSDFFYFNDFYLLAAVLVAALLVIIFQGR